MQSPAIKNDEAADLLAQILPKPSGKIIADRFDTAAETAPCGATCSGQCHGFV